MKVDRNGIEIRLTGWKATAFNVGCGGLLLAFLVVVFALGLARLLDVIAGAAR